MIRSFRRISPVIGGTILLHVFNWPSYMANLEYWHPIAASTWRWIASVIAGVSDIALGIIGLSLILMGVAEWTSRWWKPRVASVFRARKADTAHAALPIDVATQDQVERFKELVPQLERLSAYCRPRNALSLQPLIAFDPLTLPDIRANYLTICAVLDSLGIEYPSTEPVRGSEDWFYFATLMTKLASQGRLTDAQEREYE